MLRRSLQLIDGPADVATGAGTGTDEENIQDASDDASDSALSITMVSLTFAFFLALFLAYYYRRYIHKDRVLTPRNSHFRSTTNNTLGEEQVSKTPTSQTMYTDHRSPGSTHMVFLDPSVVTKSKLDRNYSNTSTELSEDQSASRSSKSSRQSEKPESINPYQSASSRTRKFSRQSEKPESTTTSQSASSRSGKSSQHSEKPESKNMSQSASSRASKSSRQSAKPASKKTSQSASSRSSKSSQHSEKSESKNMSQSANSRSSRTLPMQEAYSSWWNSPDSNAKTGAAKAVKVVTGTAARMSQRLRPGNVRTKSDTYLDASSTVGLPSILKSTIRSPVGAANEWDSSTSDHSFDIDANYSMCSIGDEIDEDSILGEPLSFT